MITNELPIIQKTYDLIKWYIPIIDRLPKYHRVTLGDRITSELYGLLEGLVIARFSREEKLDKLQKLNAQLQILRYQTRLLKDFQLIAIKRYEYASQLIDEIGLALGRWIKQQKTSASAAS